MILDGDTENESDGESEGGVVWKKQKVGDLLGAERLVREFEANEQAQQRKGVMLRKGNRSSRGKQK